MCAKEWCHKNMFSISLSIYTRWWGMSIFVIVCVNCWNGHNIFIYSPYQLKPGCPCFVNLLNVLQLFLLGSLGDCFSFFLSVPKGQKKTNHFDNILFYFSWFFMFCDVKICFLFVSSALQCANHTKQYKVQCLKGSQSPFLLTKTYLSLAT